MSSLWKKNASLNSLNKSCENTMIEHLGIEFIELGDDYLVASMPVDHRTHQPMQLLHGGASIALAETVGSLAANIAVGEGYYCVGQEVNGNHMRSATQGKVYAKAVPKHIGRTTHVWVIDITDEAKRLICTSRLTMAVLKHSEKRN
jgi:1,4-dihydroxy-2-naphthoyl-CoA hydrolase